MPVKGLAISLADSNNNFSKFHVPGMEPASYLVVKAQRDQSANIG
jgi:hypothetical protein